MMKQIKWNKKRKWQDTRYCKPFIARLALRRVNTAAMAASALARLSAMSSVFLSEKPASVSGNSQADKRAAMSGLVIGTVTCISNELAKGGKK